MKKILVGILFVFVSFVVVLVKGNTYTIVADTKANNVNDIIIEFDKGNIIEVKNKEIKEGSIYVTVKALNKGKDYISVYYNNESIFISSIYVHTFNIITEETFFGNTNGGIVIPICFLAYLIYLTISIIVKYRKDSKENLYQYKNIINLGLIIFLVGLIINQTINLFSYRGLFGLIQLTLNSGNFFAMFLLPIAFVVSILVTISNFVLIKKEGRSLKNLLGLILGILICFGTILPLLISDFMQGNVMSVHDMNGFMYHLDLFVESLIIEIVAYLECILLGTIIISVKAARRIPELNKDYIIILGCQIRKDGTLTPLLRGRVDRALEFSKMQKKDIKFIASGGKGSDEVISEALAIKNYLVENKVEENKIIVEDKSKNTYENIKNSFKLIGDKNANVAYSTTNFHVFRAGVIATSLGFKLEGIGSKTKRYYWINAFIREFIATIVVEKKKHLKIASLIFLATVLMVAVVYLANNL